MDGPSHYREAERLLAAAGIEGAEGVIWVRPENLAAAQVHATLALAAATALNDHDHEGGGMPIADYKAWRKTAGVPFPTCSQCDREVSPGSVYCSTICRNLDDKHDNGEVSA